jgi:L-histidine Nalpha-methyltransferase
VRSSISQHPGDVIQAVADDPASQSIILGQHEGDVRDFAASVARSLNDSPPWLHCRFLYDRRGSELFQAICEQPEYYLTRTEASILRANANDIASVTGPVTLIELGSGDSAKTDYLLSAYAGAGKPILYVPIDISIAALDAARREIVRRHPTVTVTAIAGTYDEAFPLIRRFSPSMVIFLGSTIGNFNQLEADAFWTTVAAALEPGDHFLLGVDLVKDGAILNAAYNDAAGVTEEFTKNLLARMNRELGSGIDLDTVDHVASYHADWQRIETFLRFNEDQDVAVEPLGMTIPIAAGTMVMTEISRKFTIQQLRENLQLHGFQVRRVYTDPQDWFGLLLLQRDGESRVGER